MSRELLKQALQEADNVSHFAESNGTKVYSFEDAQTLNKADLILEKVNGKSPDLGERMVTNNGLTYARSNVKRGAIDPETFFENRYRKVDDYYEVVTDYRAIKEQSSGQVYTNNLVVYVVGKVGKGLAVVTTKVINSDVFVQEFKNKLDVDSLKMVLEAIGKLDNTGLVADKILL